MPSAQQLFFDKNSDAIIIHEVCGKIIYSNPKTKAIFGYTSEQLLNQNIYSFLLEGNQRDFTQESIGSSKVFVKTANKDTIFIKMKTSIINNDDKDSPLLFRSFHPAESDVSLNWMYSVLNHLRSGVVVSDPNLPDNPIVFANKAFLQMTGYNEDEIIGKNCRFLQGDKKDQPALQILREAISSKKPCNVILENYKKDGTPFINQLDISVVYDEKNHPSHFVGLQYDITEKMQQQVELAKQKEIAMTASKMAALGEMAGSISHEINNPLMILRTHIDDIHEHLESHKNLSVEVNESLSKMDETINRVARIVKSLREFSRRSDPKEITCESVENLIQETLDFCQDRLRNENINLIVNLQNSTQVLMRKIEISQILINLINNSIDEIIDQEDKRIIIESKLTAKHCFISVSDYGKGIPLENKTSIFTPFFTTKILGKGTGLGLSISKKIMTSHGGTIELTSPKNPTTFTLKLRLQAD